MALSIINNCNKCVIKWNKDIMWHFCGKRILMSVYWNDYSCILTTCHLCSWLFGVLLLCFQLGRLLHVGGCICIPCSSLIIACCTNTHTICCIHFKAKAQQSQTAKIINVYNFIISKIDKLLFSMHLVSFTRWLLALSITAINVWSNGIGISYDLSVKTGY